MAVLSFLVKQHNSINVFDIKGKFLCSIKNGKCSCNEYMVFDKCIHINLINRVPLYIQQEEVHKILEMCQTILPCSVDKLELKEDVITVIWLKARLAIRGIFDLLCENLPYKIKVVS